jgi:hypothetical protein
MMWSFHSSAAEQSGHRIKVGRMKRSASGGGSGYGNDSGSAALDPDYQKHQKNMQASFPYPELRYNSKHRFKIL